MRLTHDVVAVGSAHAGGEDDFGVDGGDEAGGGDGELWAARVGTTGVENRASRQRPAWQGGLWRSADHCLRCAGDGNDWNGRRRRNSGHGDKGLDRQDGHGFDLRRAGRRLHGKGCSNRSGDRCGGRLGMVPAEVMAVQEIVRGQGGRAREEAFASAINGGKLVRAAAETGREKEGGKGSGSQLRQRAEHGSCRRRIRGAQGRFVRSWLPPSNVACVLATCGEQATRSVADEQHI